MFILKIKPCKSRLTEISLKKENGERLLKSVLKKGGKGVSSDWNRKKDG